MRRPWIAFAGLVWVLATCTRPAEDVVITPLSYSTSALPADTCPGTVWEVSTLPFLDNATTAGLTDDYDIGGTGTCAGGGIQWGLSGDGEDIVYRIDVDQTCDLAVTIDPTGLDDLNVFAVTNCLALDTSCLDHQDNGSGGDPETINFTAVAGVDYFIIVDGYDGGVGPFDITITETTMTGCGLGRVACTGMNDGRFCADDGNECTDDVCNTGICMSTNDDTNPCTDGNSCTDDACSGGTCVGTNDDSNTCSDGDACTDDTCVMGACVSMPGTSLPCTTCASLPLISSALPHVIMGDTTSGTDVFNIGASGTCAGGGTQYAASGVGPDDAHRIQVDRTCDLEVIMDPASGDMNVTVVRDCGDLAGSCERVADVFGGGGAETANFTAQAGVRYVAIVDGWQGGLGPYTLTISETSATGCRMGLPLVVCDGSNNGQPCDDGNPCTDPGMCAMGSCGAGPANDSLSCSDSDTCTDDVCSSGACLSTERAQCTLCNGLPLLFETMPYTVTGDNTLSMDVIDLDAAGTCAGGGSQYSGTGEGGEDVYRFQVDQDCQIRVNDTPHTGAETSLYVLSDCGDIAGGCMAVDDFGSPGDAEEVEFAAVAGVDYYVVIDGYNGSNGPYTLTIEEVGVTGCKLEPPRVTCDGSNDGAFCDDGNACTRPDNCAGGMCQGVADDSALCDDGNACTDDVCSAGTCVTTDDDTNNCTDGNDCTDDVCTAGSCVSTNDDTNACTDTTFCTDDTCQNGVCISVVTDCSGLDSDCRAGTCNPSTGFCEAVPANEAASCSDGDLCTENGVCTGGACVSTPKDCSSLNNGCVTGACDAGTGMCVPNGGDCSGLDGTCVTGTCNLVNGQCEAITDMDGTPCSDGDPCSTADACQSGTCMATPLVCMSACNAGGCNPVSGVCDIIPINAGGSCDDSDPCTVNDRCAQGSCSGTRRDCSLLDDVCLRGSCNPMSGVCEPVPANDGVGCDDGDLCTKRDQCSAGMCGGIAKDCSAFDGACAAGACDASTGQCTATPINDGNPCDPGDGCPGACAVGFCASDPSCRDGEPLPDPAPGDPSGCSCAGGARETGDAWALGAVLLGGLRRRRRRQRGGTP